MLHLVENFPLFLLIGFLAGFFNAYLGIGGGTVITGLLSILMNDMTVTAGISITCCLLVSLSSLFLKRKDIKKEDILKKGLYRVIIFRSLLLLITMQIILNKEREVINFISSNALLLFLFYIFQANVFKKETRKHNKMMDIFMGIATGILYPLTGVSGGILFTSFFKKQYGISYEIAVFHSLIITVVTSFFAVGVYFIIYPGVVKIKVVLLILIGSLLGIVLGRKCLKESSDKNVFYCINIVIFCMIFGIILKLIGVDSFLNLIVTTVPLVIISIMGLSQLKNRFGKVRGKSPHLH